MYVAIEGIKGSGKSTIIKNLIAQDSQRTRAINFFPITASMDKNHPMEILHNVNPSLKNNDAFIESLFLQRARWHYKNIEDHKSSILGDRCVATACVTRWRKWDDPYYTIKKIKMDYDNIQSPDVIVWLNTSVNQALKNIQERTGKSLGKTDEKPEILAKAAEAYEELFLNHIYSKKINPVQIIKIHNHSDITEITKEIQSIIKFYRAL